MENYKSKSVVPKTDRGLKTKQKLLDASELVFGEMGYYQAGITDITREANVSLGTFYTYFQSKEDIFRDLVMHMQKILRKEIVEKTDGITDRIELEREGLKIFFNFLQKHKYLFRLFRQAEFVDEELHRQFYETFSKGYIEGLSKAMETEQIRNINPIILVYSFMGIMDYVGMKWVLWEGREVNDDFIDEIMSFIKYGIVKTRVDD
ncbi:TetR/AcrR family transcriptional regulator [Alkalihalobacterium elongatum]|uniref:TetR/AcrR family transcriptional regulator n=1 Tax=Alkalihalobacterium elongatum TaxID=2675466 RepID=UPI001C1FDF90|nr:TetR/AcrR family transcriptional regulator [Alkalihalobacterium elongatum]